MSREELVTINEAFSVVGTPPPPNRAQRRAMRRHHRERVNRRNEKILHAISGPSIYSDAPSPGMAELPEYKPQHAEAIGRGQRHSKARRGDAYRIAGRPERVSEDSAIAEQFDPSAH